MRFVQRLKLNSGLEKTVQHKTLLLFPEKVIVAKVKLCSGIDDHNEPPYFLAADIIPRVVE